VLEIGRDLAERNKSVAFLIRLEVNPSLETALDMDGVDRGVDPPNGHRGNRGKRPKRHYTVDKLLKKGSEKTLPMPCPGGLVESFSHIAEESF